MKKNILLAIVTILIGAGCYYGDPGIVTSDTSYGLIGITADGDYPADSFAVAGDAAFIVVHAPSTNGGGNTRAGFTIEGPDTYVNSSCATWQGHTGPIDQPGAILHFNGTEFISVTQNIYAGARHVINVHHWNLTVPANADRFTLLAQYTPPSMAAPEQWPWRMCAEAFGPTVSFKVWPLTMPEPAYGDPCCGASLPVEYHADGRPGWFAGHLSPGGAMAFSDLMTESYNP